MDRDTVAFRYVELEGSDFLAIVHREVDAAGNVTERVFLLPEWCPGSGAAREIEYARSAILAE